MEEDSIPRLLLIEASSADLYIFDYYLYPHFEVFAAECGEDALQLLKKMPFDAVLIDAKLPDCKPGDLIDTMQTHYGPLPIILMTGIEVDAIQLITPINGVSSCINKDLITNEGLLESVWKVIDHSPVLCSMIHPNS